MVVDDDPWIQRIVARALGQRGHQVSLAGEATGAFVVASKIKPDLILTAISLPAIEGWAWWERLRTLPACADAPIIFLLSDVDESTSISGASAVYDALSWRTGSFDFLIGDIGGVDEIQSSTTFLLLEAARRIDEANEDRRLGAGKSKI